jgi:hypothetical protein
MKLKGSCHCGAVRFSIESRTPYPFNVCYCSICRKTQGGGGFAINIMGQAETLQVFGEEYLSTYRAVKGEGGQESELRRHFCKNCGSALFIRDPRYPDWVYPFASAIDSELPTAPDYVHLMLGSKAPWVPVPPEGPQHKHFPEYPDGSIETWHKDRGLLDE